jgi:predicted RNase H-like HicB family nuclease
MEKLINIHIEKLPEGLYLATSEDVQGLVAQGRTVAETLEIARDIIRKLLEAQAERENTVNRYTTIPNHPGDMSEGTLRAILKQAGVSPDTFLNN